MDFEKLKHLSKNVSQRFQKGELKRLTIYRGEGFVCYDDHIWCEIDLSSEKTTASIFIEGMSPLGYLFSDSAFEPENYYKEKTKVYEGEIPKKEILHFLDKIFFDYDLRLLGEDALSSHPGANYDYINDLVSFNDSAEGFSVELEAVDGIIDKVRMDRYSIGGNLLYSFIKYSETLKKIFVI